MTRALSPDDPPEDATARRLAALARLSPDFLYVVDYASKRVLWANRSLPEALGYSADQIRTLGDRLISSITHPQDLADVVDRWVELESLPDGELAIYNRRLRDA